MSRVVVLGGGIGGLSAAWRLAKRLDPSCITVLEASNRVGGWIESTRTADGAVFEHGPRSLRLSANGGSASISLVEELGLGDQVLPVPVSNKSAKRRLIYRDGKMIELGGVMGLFRRSEPFTEPLAKTIVREVLKKKNTPTYEDETVDQFIERRLGKEVAHWLVDPMCRGIFAGNSKQLSMKSCFPLIYKYERQYGSIIRGAVFSKREKARHKQSELVKQSKQSWLMWSLKNGLESLPTALAHSLSARGVDLLRNRPCTGLEITEKGVKVHVKGANNAIEVNAVVSAIPAWRLGDLLISTHPELASHLKKISAVTVAVASFEFDGKVLPTEAFGYLVPSHQQTKALGVVFDSCSFPEHDRKGSPSTRLTVMMGGQWFHELFGDPHSVSEDQLIAAARETIIDHLGIKSEPTKVFIRVQKDCIPQYTVGHDKTMDAIDRYIEDRALPLTLVGSSYRAVAINDIIDLAMQAADRLCDSLTTDE